MSNIESKIVIVDKDGNEHPYDPALILPRPGATVSRKATNFDGRVTWTRPDKSPSIPRIHGDVE